MKIQKISHKDGSRVTVQKPKGNQSVIRFGSNLRNDPTAVYRMVKLDADTGKAEHVAREPIPKKGVVVMDLEPLTNYILVAAGSESAGMVSTVELNLQAPFMLAIDAGAVNFKAVQEQQALAEKQAEGQKHMRMKPLALAVKRTLH